MLFVIGAALDSEKFLPSARLQQKQQQQKPEREREKFPVPQRNAAQKNKHLQKGKDGITRRTRQFENN